MRQQFWMGHAELQKQRGHLPPSQFLVLYQENVNYSGMFLFAHPSFLGNGTEVSSL